MAGGAGHEMAREVRDVDPALGQGRHRQRDDIEAVEQVLAELAGRHLGLEVAVGRGDDADVDLDPRVAAKAREALLLQHPQDLALRFQWHVGDLVDQQSNT